MSRGLRNAIREAEAAVKATTDAGEALAAIGGAVKDKLTPGLTFVHWRYHGLASLWGDEPEKACADNAKGARDALTEAQHFEAALNGLTLPDGDAATNLATSVARITAAGRLCVQILQDPDVCPPS